MIKDINNVYNKTRESTIKYLLSSLYTDTLLIVNNVLWWIYINTKKFVYKNKIIIIIKLNK